MPKTSVEYEQHQREKIIEGAAQAFAEKGYRQTTIDGIAERLKISKGAIYIYFKSKEELFAAIYDYFMELRLGAIRHSYHPEDTVSVKLEKVLDQFIVMLIQGDEVFCRLWLELYLEGPRISMVQRLTQHKYEQLYKVIYDLLSEGQRTGELKQDMDIASFTTVILATCDGLILNSLKDKGSGNPQAIRQAMWSIFYNAVRL